MALPISECLREARSVPCFSGSDDYSLTTYLRDIETVLSLTSEGDKGVVQKVILNRLRGRALHSIETLVTPTYTQIVEKLKEEFGIKTTFINLRNEAMNVEANNIQDLHNKLSKVLHKMNSKYLLNNGVDVLYTPINNEIMIFEVYINFLPCHIKTLLLQNNINTISKAYNYYIANNIIQDIEIINRNRTINNRGQNKYTLFNNYNQREFSIYTLNSLCYNSNNNSTQRVNRNNFNNANTNNNQREYDAVNRAHYRNTGYVEHNSNAQNRQSRNDNRPFNSGNYRHYNDAVNNKQFRNDNVMSYNDRPFNSDNHDHYNGAVNSAQYRSNNVMQNNSRSFNRNLQRNNCGAANSQEYTQRNVMPNNNSGNYRRFNFNTGANNQVVQQSVEPMEVDNLQTFENFRLSPLNPDYP